MSDLELFSGFENKKFVCSAGQHNAVCVGVDDLGMQPGYDGEDPVRKVVLRFEVDEVIPEGPLKGSPYWVSKIVNFKTNEKSFLVQTLIDWLGYNPVGKSKGTCFKLDTLIGKPATVTVQHKPKGDGITAVIRKIYAHNKNDVVLTPSSGSSEPPEWVIKMQGARLDKHAVSLSPTPKTSSAPQQAPKPVQKPIPPPAPAATVKVQPPAPTPNFEETATGGTDLFDEVEVIEDNDSSEDNEGNASNTNDNGSNI